MAWLARLDARAARWTRPRFWLYHVTKWNLVAIGAVALIGVGLESLGRREVGLGVAFLSYLTFTLITEAPHWRHHLARGRQALARHRRVDP